jgi:hypothetical protein
MWRGKEGDRGEGKGKEGREGDRGRWNANRV